MFTVTLRTDSRLRSAGTTGATIRRHDVPDGRAFGALSRSTPSSQSATKKSFCESLRRIATADAAALCAVAGVRTGRITSRESNQSAACDPASPHSCQRRPAGPTSVSAGKPLIFSPDFVAFVSFVPLRVLRRRRTENPSCRRIVAPSCKREAQSSGAAVGRSQPEASTLMR